MLITHRGIITEDPTGVMVNGSEIFVNPRSHRFPPVQGLQAINNWDAFDGAMLFVHVGTTSSHQVVGSAVLVAPGIALTATHVIEPHLRDAVAGKCSLLLTGIAKNGMMIWMPHQLVTNPYTDITTISLTYRAQLPTDETFNLAALSTRTPEIGEQISIVGFRESRTELVAGMTGAHVRGQMHVASGRVSQIFRTQRDSAMLAWPTIEVECFAIGGMSGGPAFDEEGFVIGLLSSSVESSDQCGPSYVSLTWPALASKIRPVWPQGLFSKETSLLEMDRRLCGLERPEAIAVALDNATGMPVVDYRTWSNRNA